ncbi:MAG: response regulator [Opitutales bacterium]|nr:response regulator [Opitutales bacterium]
MFNTPALAEREQGTQSAENSGFAGGFERESRNYHYNTLLKSLLAGYWEWDLASNHFFASPSLKSLLGMAPRGAVSVHGRCPEFISENDTRRWRQAVTRLITDRRSEGVEEDAIACVDADGNERPTHLRMCVIDRDNGGVPVRIGGCFLDLGTLLPEKEKTAEHDDTAAGPIKFISAVSHEIRTPLMSILGTTQLLREENPRDDQVENLEALRFAGSALLSLVNDILDLSKVEIGNLVLEENEFSVESISSSVLDAFSFQKRRKAIELTLEIEEGLPATVRGDANRLSQMLFNLVGNAVKFTEDGEVRVRISPVSTAGGKTTLRFEIADTGIGIDQEHMHDLFEPFGKASSSTGRVYGGTGLGLAITKRLAEMQGGTISCKSTRGKGTAFSLEIPYKGVERKNTSHQWQNPFRFRPLRGRVLLVEDNPVIAKITRKFLEKWCVEVHHAASGENGLAAFEEQSFNLILMDLQLPGMSGWETARRIHETNIDTNGRVPVITMTASVPENSRARLCEYGIDDLLLKPVHPQRLYQIVAQHLPVRA